MYVQTTSMALASRPVVCWALTMLLLLSQCCMDCWSDPSQAGVSVEVVRTLVVTRGSAANLAGSFHVEYNRSLIPICTIRAVSDGHPCGYVTPDNFACDEQLSTTTYFHLGCQSLYETLNFEVVMVTYGGRAVTGIFFSVSVHVVNISAQQVVASYDADLGALAVQFPAEMTGKCSYAFVQHPTLPSPAQGNLSIPHRFQYQQPLPCGYQPAPYISYTPAQRNTSSTDYVSLRVKCWQKWNYLSSTVHSIFPIYQGNKEITVMQLQKFYLDVHELSDTLLSSSLIPISHLTGNHNFFKFTFPVLKLGGVFSAVAAQWGILDATTFTLAQLEQNTVHFRPNESSVGGSTMQLAYHYHVTDVAGIMLAEGDMEVRVHPRTGARPSVRTNAVLMVGQGGSVEINSSHISLYPPVECANFSVCIVQPAMHGWILLPSGDLAGSNHYYSLPLLYSNDGSKSHRDFSIWSLKCANYDAILVQISLHILQADNDQKIIYSQVRTFQGYAIPLDHSILGWPNLPSSNSVLTVQATAGTLLHTCGNSSIAGVIKLGNSSLYPFIHHSDINCTLCSAHLHIPAKDLLSQCLWYLTLPSLNVTHSSVTFALTDEGLLSQLSIVVVNQSLQSTFVPQAVELIGTEDNTMSTLPILLRNKPLPLHNLDAVHITLDYLYVQSMGYLPDEIVIHITNLPSFGLLCNIYQIQCTTSIFTFTQEDVALQRVYYQPQATITVARYDTFKFEIYYLEDEKLPSTYTFTMGLLDNENTTSPRKQFWAALAGSKPLSRKFVRHITNSLNNKKTVFQVLDGPNFGILEHPNQNGSFSYTDLQQRRVVYHHNGKLVCSDWILLSAMDGKKVIRTNLTIAIRLHPKTALSLHTGEHSLESKQSFVLTVSDLQVQSSFCPEFVQLSIIQPPGYGLVMLNDTRHKIVRHLGLNSIFTSLDVLQGLVSYVMIPNIAIVGNTSDSLLLTLQEPSTKEKDIVKRDMGHTPTSGGVYQFFVYITPSGKLEDAIAINFTVQSPKNIHPLGKHHYGAYFGPNDFHLWNNNIDPAEPRIVIDQYPFLGQLMKGDFPVNDFSLADIYAGKIRYEVSRDKLNLNTTSDHFRFSILLTINGVTTRIASTEIFLLQWCFFFIDKSASSFINQEQLDAWATFIVRRTGPDLSFPAEVNIATKADNATSVDHCNGIQTTAGGNPPGDYCAVSMRLMFAEQQAKKSLVVKLLDDDLAEGQEDFWLVLTEPEGCIIPPIDYSVWITDFEDYSFISFSESQLGEAVDEVLLPCKIGTKIYETVGVANILLTRTGNINHEVGVVCYTGNSLGMYLASSDDYVPRPNNTTSVVYFKPGEQSTFCPVEIINDMQNENLDSFYIYLGDPVGYAHTDSSSSPMCVFIQHDNEDTPKVSFNVASISVQENQDHAQEVWFSLLREGTDLSFPTDVRCEPGVNSNASDGVDFRFQSDIPLTFPSGEVKVSGVITILPDSEREGTEVLYLVMTPPFSGRTGSPHILEVIITDSLHDTIVGIADTHFTFSETQPLATIPLHRHGYTDNVTNISCFLQPISATGTSTFQPGITDFLTSNKAEHVIFLPGDTSAGCHVFIVDDAIWEGPEQLEVVITPSDPTVQTIQIENRTAKITIQDPEDVPVFQFTQSVYNTTEPLTNNPPDQLSVILVVIRSRDLTVNSTITWAAEDHSAVMGLDYNISRGTLHFPPFVMTQNLNIPVLANHGRQEDSQFVVRLELQSSYSANLGDPSSALVHIRNKVVTGVFFPDLPLVRSLVRSHSGGGSYLFSDDFFFDQAISCITPCEEEYDHPHKDFYHSECSRQEIDLSQTQFTWEISHNGSYFVPVELDTFFTSSHLQVLESVYLKADLFVRCIASAVNVNSVKGYARTSLPVRLTKKFASCTDKEEVFSVSLSSYESFSGSNDDLLEVEIRLPEVANTIPLVTTTATTNNSIVTLLTNLAETQQYLCSNLFLPHTINDGVLPLAEGASSTDQHTTGSKSGEIYHHYDTDTCQWNFSLWFPLHVLLASCGATLSTSPYRLTLPVHVTYVTITDNAPEIVQSQHLSVVFSSNASLHSAITASPFTYHPTNNHHDAYLCLMAVDLSPGSDRARIALYSYAEFNGRFLSGSITQQQSSQDYMESHAAMPVYSGVKGSKVAKQAWLLEACIGRLSASTLLLVSLKACTYSGDHCAGEDIYTFELPVSVEANAAEGGVTMRASLQLGLEVWKSSQLLHTNISHHLSGNTLVLLTVSLDPSQHLISNHSLIITEAWVCLSTGDYILKSNKGGCNSLHSSILHVSQLLASNGDTGKNTEVVTGTDSAILILFVADPLIEYTSQNGSWYLQIAAAVTSTTSGLIVLRQQEMVPLSLLGPKVPFAPSFSSTTQSTVLSSRVSIDPTSLPSVPVHAIVLISVMLVVFLVVCSVTSVLLCLTLKQRWLLRNQAATASHGEKSMDCIDQEQSSSSVKTEQSSNTISKAVQTRQKKSLELLLYKATEMYRQGNNSTAAIAIPNKSPLQQSASLPDLHARNTTQPRTGTILQLLLPVTNIHSDQSTAQVAALRTLSRCPVMNNDINNRQALVKQTMDTNLHIKERIPHRTIPRKVSVHSAGWYERHQARQKAMASYAQLYLAAGAATPEPGTSPSTRL